ncbi:hypothetical protein [Haloferula sp. A504]|uniref:hypothetical protein n=1 Tax=Haloferula sp. A504 TaxID=3373601 RepID=UPI0031BFAF30|nr:hypothetical protein [Verrucomicrobiaceae bacterium E54]
MNPDSIGTIGTIGYLGFALALAAVATWLVYWGMKKRFLVRLGFVLALAALACAKIHSATHVDRIEIDPSIQLAMMKAKQEERRQAALDLRGDEVAQIRFAEDDGEEFMDKAGLEESDLEYYDSLEEPAWKKNKRTRSSEGEEDTSLDALIDTEEAEGGADVEALEAEKGPEPILMGEEEVVAARRIDRWNGRVSLALPILGLLLLGYDYLRRANRYAEASFPLPLPSALPGSITPMPAVVERSDPPRRPVVAELAWLARRGDSFLYLADEPLKAAKALEQLQPLAAKHRRFDLLPLGDDTIDDDFVFESLWFGRCSFVVESPDRIEALIRRFTELMQQRRKTRARVRQVAHLVWDLPGKTPGEELTQLAARTGFSIFLVANQSH